MKYDTVMMGASLQKRFTCTISANSSDNVFQSIMPDEETGRDGIFEDWTWSQKWEELPACRSECASVFKVKMGSRNVEHNKCKWKRWRSSCLHSSFPFAGYLNSKHVCKQNHPETFAVNLKECSVSFDLFRSVYSPVTALQSCTVI